MVLKIANFSSLFLRDGSIDPGLMIINGKLNDNITFENAEKTLANVFQELITQTSESLKKVKNMATSSITFWRNKFIK